MSSSYPSDKRCLEILRQIVIALKSFEGKYEKKLNISKLASYLRLSERDANEYLKFLLDMQEEFKEFFRIFQNRELSQRREGGNVYLTAKRAYELLPDTIILKKDHAGWLSDLIYAFKHVKKGKGFDLSNNNAEIINHLRLLMDVHPYFFIKNGNELVYPSRLASELGSILLSYKKLNKKIDTIEILNSNIKVK